MTIFITKALSSAPGSLTPGKAGTLRMGLMTNQSPSERAQIQYQIVAPPGVVFVSTNSPFLSDSPEVFSTGSTAVTSYALNGPSGLVNIRASVTPSGPPAASATAVAQTSALAAAAAPRAAARGARSAGPVAPTPKAAMKKAAQRKKAAAKTKKKAVARKKPVAKKVPRSKGKGST